MTTQGPNEPRATVDDVIGRTLGSYQIVDRIGEGGMGVVYIAQHPLIGRKAAVKLLLPQYSQNKEVVDRFFNEARAATLVKHGGIVDIFDFGYTDEGNAYIVMEYLDGESLTDRLARGPLPEDHAARLARQAASALAAAHAAGIIHRDLKPDNIFVVADSEVRGGERIKVLDFGIAKLSGEASGAMTKTQTGTMMGSPYYMSPEQCRGAGGVDARTDIYSLGCVVYEMVCGQPPFTAEGVGELIGKHIYEQPPPPRALAPALSAPFERVILDALAKDPNQRIASMNAFITELDRATAHRFATGSARPTAATPVLPATGASQPGAAAGPSPELAALRRGRGRWLAVGAVALAAALAAAVVLGGGDQPAPTPAEPHTTATATATGAAPSAAAAPASVTAQPAETPSAARSPTTVKFTITAQPRALVRGADGALLGETPYSVTVPTSAETHRFQLQARGYRDEELALVADQDRSTAVALTKLTRRTPSRKPKPGSKPKPDDEKDPYDPFE